MVAECLSDGTAKRDRGIKYTDYQAHGVEEYWIIDADEGVVEHYHLVDGAYQLILKSGEGHIRCFAVPSFMIPIPAIFDEDVNRQTITAILQSESLV